MEGFYLLLPGTTSQLDSLLYYLLAFDSKIVEVHILEIF